MGHARIGRVRMKNGGADLHVLHTAKHPDLDEADWRSMLVRHAVSIASDTTPIAGYFIMAVFEDGTYNSASRVDFERSPIPLTLWPAYIEEVARTKLVSEKTVHDVLKESYVLR